MLKNISKLETMVAGKVHQYLCDHDSQLDHVIEALVQFLSYVKQVKDAAATQKMTEDIQPNIQEQKEEEDVDKCVPTSRICC